MSEFYSRICQYSVHILR